MIHRQKHAFLIIAHQEFRVLQELVEALDHECNDIYIHIDAKIKKIPILKTLHSRLYILNNRIKVIWGDVSQIACEILLMEEAYKKNDSYVLFHIISGIHYPIVNLEKFFVFFDEYKGRFSFLQRMDSNTDEAKMRLGRYHFFLKHLISKKVFLRKIYHFLWVSTLFLEKRIGIERDYSYERGKSSNWCSLSKEAVKVIISEKEKILKRFSYTFCADEFFVPSVIGEHNLPVIYSKELLYVDFVASTPRVLMEDDYDIIMNSGCLFARKFTSQSLSLIEKIKNGKDKDIYNKSGKVIYS